MKKHLRTGSLLMAVVVLAASCNITDKKKSATDSLKIDSIKKDSLKKDSVMKDSVKIATKAVSPNDTTVKTADSVPPVAASPTPPGPTHPPGKN